MNSDKDITQIGIAVEQINIDESHINNQVDPDALSILPTRNLVMFPGVTISIGLGREMSEKVALHAYKNMKPVGIVCQRDPDNESPKLTTGMYRYGVVADILKVMDIPGGEKTLLVRAREPFKILGAGTKGGYPAGSLVAKVEVLPLTISEDTESRLPFVMKDIHKKLATIAENLPDPMAHMLKSINNVNDDDMVVHGTLTHLPCNPAEKVKLLALTDFYKRALGLLKILMEKEEEINISMAIMREVKSTMNEEQRRVFLQQQIATIQEQLYGDASTDIDQLQAKADALNLPEAARTAFDREMLKLRRINPANPDYSVGYTYLETLLDIPWTEKDPLDKDLAYATNILERDHYGLDKVKERILEQLAVMIHNPEGRSPIICLVGPPGVGKTSLGKSVADALGRKYARVSLGGLHDEAEIRGHRRTYIGSMPGRVIEAMRRAKSTNPVVVLDEVDKIGADYKGDPEAALLEVLDPEQNCRFHDNYLDLDYDLSNVMFIATANSLSTISQPLLDRMEIINLSGYLAEEKVEIANRHLIPRMLKEMKIRATSLQISDEALHHIISRYTNESGVRQLDKVLHKIGRKHIMAKMSKKRFPKMVEVKHLPDLLGLAPYSKDEYENNDFAGVVTGLAWTQVGGEILLVESSLTPGKGDRLTLTGNLGDVMKESATIAMQWVKANADELGIDPALFGKYDLHLHFPEGAIPKDGPSAGITIATSIVSSFTQRRVRARVAMTGEITLRGKVLPVGGIKEKILAAKRALSITDIAMSEDNRKDVEDISAAYTSGLTFHYFSRVADVISYAVTEDPVAHPKAL